MRKHAFRATAVKIALSLCLIGGGVVASVGHAPAITGNKKALVVLCNFSNETQQPNPPSYYQHMFSDAGSGELGALDYWHDVSYGNFGVSGTVVKGWYTLPITRDTWVGYTRQSNNKWKSCAEAAKNDVQYNQFAGVVVVIPNAYGTLAAGVSADATTLTLNSTTSGASANFPTPPFLAGVDSETVNVTAVNGTTFTIQRAQSGSTAATHAQGATLAVGNDLYGFTPFSQSLGGQPATTLGGEVMSHDHPLDLALHEEAHLFGFNHSRAVSQWDPNGGGNEYNDCYDLESELSCVHNFDLGSGFGSSELGFARPPGLNAVQLDLQGWLSSARETTFDNSSCRQQTYNLASLNHADASGFQEVRIPASGTFPVVNGTINVDYYTLELRTKDGWDQGLPGNLFVVHLKGSDGRSYLVDKDRDGKFVGTLGEQGALRPDLFYSHTYVDTTAKAFVAVNSIDAASHTGVLTVGGCKINPALTYSGGTTAGWGAPLTLAADLVVAGTTAPVPDEVVTFTAGTQGCSARTDVHGHASCTIDSVEQPPGSYAVTAAFGGNPAYNAANTTSSLTVTCDHTVTGAQGNVTLAPGTNCVSGNISGSLTVPAGTRLALRNATVGGALNSTGAASVVVCGSTVWSAVNVSGTTRFVLLGDPGDDGCAANVFHSNVNVLSNKGGAELVSNRIYGTVTVNNNFGGGPYTDDNTVEIESNTISGGLRCSANTPPVTDDGHPNSVAGGRVGECASPSTF